VFDAKGGPVIDSIMFMTFSSVRCARATTECAGVSLYRRKWGTEENGRDTVVVPESGRDTFVGRQNSPGRSGV
jgi:hypothetical protein